MKGYIKVYTGNGKGKTTAFIQALDSFAVRQKSV